MTNFDEPDDYAEFLEQIIAGEHLDGAALGIKKLVIAKGENSISAAQAHVFKTQVKDVYILDECSRCGNDIPWSEMYAASDNGGLCNWCDHMSSKEN